ncbi:MAG TPA: hypothetical protein VFJ30_16955 [Phycisphaerae bacterium]|nr:hypothetical protein [Phycisphaerae bacterium]
MTKRTTWALLGTVAVFLGVSGRSPAAPPTIEDLAKLPTTGLLGQAGENVVERYVASWTEELRDAKTPETVKRAIENGRVGYRANSGAGYQVEYAKKVAAAAPACLKLDGDPLRRLKEINLAILVSEFDRYTILPMLEAMAAHENPGVRYWAARGFRETGKRFLVQGGRYARVMADTLEKLGLTDPAGPVVTEAIVALGEYSGEESPGGKALAAALAKVWLARCQEVLAGREGMADVIRRSLRVVPRVAQMHMDPQTRTPQARKAALQMLADAMDAASRAFAGGAGGEDIAQTKALQRLLIGIETSAAAMFGVNERPVSGVLAGKEPLAVQRVQVRLKVNVFWTPKFQAEGVTSQVKAPATAPATTRPAG